MKPIGICSWCRTAFMRRRGHAKFCKNACKQADYRARVILRVPHETTTPDQELTMKKGNIPHGNVGPGNGGNIPTPNVGPGNGGNLPTKNVGDGPGSKGNAGGPNHTGGSYSGGCKPGTVKQK